MNTRMTIGRCARLLWVALVSGVACTGGNAAVTVLGVQYQQDNPYPEFECLWKLQNSTNDCGSALSVTGANVHVYLKNTGASPMTIDDVTLAGYSLKTVIKMSTNLTINPRLQNSIFFYWDDPLIEAPAIMAAGEPVWYKSDPATIPPGGVGQAVVRLRFVPTTPTVAVGVVTSEGTVNTNIAVDANAPQLSSVSFSSDLSKAYLHWRRSGGAAPMTILMDGTNVTASAITAGDATLDFAESVLSPGTALSNMSYHVFQGIYADGKVASASLRAWANPFLYGSVEMFPIASDGVSGSQAWIDDAVNHGLNSVQLTRPGESFDVNYASSRNYGFVCIDNNDTRITQPQLWLVNDQPDLEEQSQSVVHCGTGLRIPCDGVHELGTLAIKEVAHGEMLRTTNAFTPTTVAIHGIHKVACFYSWGQAVDVLQFEAFYETRLADTYWYYPEMIPLNAKPTFAYAVSRAATTAAEPNPAHALLYSCEYKNSSTGQVWPFSSAESKRIEVYYTLAAGAKGITYWWFKPGYPHNGLGDQNTNQVWALWKEIGVLGNEIKTAQPLLVSSAPVNLPLNASSNVWARALASGPDTFIVLVVNDNYYNDQSGCHYTPASNATVTVALPSWMPSPTAFEISARGLNQVSALPIGNQLQVNLGTLTVTRMIVLTQDPQLLDTLQQRYDQQVRPGLCTIAPEYCANIPPSIAQHPSDQVVVSGDNAAFTVMASGTRLRFQWQTNGVNLLNGPHYSGCTNATLRIFNAGDKDATSYRCAITSDYGSANSSYATLTIITPPTLEYARQGSELVFSWTTNAMGYSLESATNLPSLNWVPVSPAPIIVGEQYVVTKSMTGAQKYYRLKKP